MFAKILEYFNIFTLILFTWTYLSDIKPIILIMLLVTFVIFIGAISTRQINLYDVLKGRKIILFLLFIIILSNIYSIASQQTFQSSLTFTVVTIFSLILCKYYNYNKFLDIMSKYFILSILASIFLIKLFPYNGTMLYEGEIAARGIYGHKNILGRYMVIAIFIFIHKIKSINNIYIKSIYCLFGILASYLVIISKSNTNIIYMFLLTPLYYIIAYRKDLISVINKIIVLVFFIFGIVVFTVSNPQFYTVLSKIAIFGRDLTFTGRNVIWNYSFQNIYFKPILGYGFDAVWSNSNIIERFISTYGFSIPHAHNGYIDTTLQLGIVGLIAMLIIFIIMMKNAKISKNQLVAIITWYIILVNFTEAAFIENTTYIFWIIIVYFCNTDIEKIKKEIRILR